MRITNDYVFFWRNRSPFSNWYKQAPFNSDGYYYNCMEQFMMHQKALLFGDHETAEKIMQANNPSEHKALGREVKPFDPAVWDAEKKRIVYIGLKAKFTEPGNESILEDLKDTAGRILVEASPYDKIWGIGMEEWEPGVEDRKNWKGLNLLGSLLTKLRVELIGK